MMLPGVESARRRRIHYHGNSHEIYPAARIASPSEPWMRPRFERTPMDESVIVARNRLEEKLYRLPHRSIPTLPMMEALLPRPGSSVRTTSVGGGGRGGESPVTAEPMLSIPTLPMMELPVMEAILPKPGSNVRTTSGGGDGRVGKGPVAAEMGPPWPVLKRKDSVTDVCPVCLEELRARGPVTKLPCSHKYHSDCLRPWLTAHSHRPFPLPIKEGS